MSKILVTQVRSAAGRTGRTKLQLKALGLGKIGKSKEFNAPNAALLGMLVKLCHLVQVKEIGR